MTPQLLDDEQTPDWIIYCTRRTPRPGGGSHPCHNERGHHGDHECTCGHHWQNPEPTP